MSDEKETKQTDRKPLKDRDIIEKGANPFPKQDQNEPPPPPPYEEPKKK